MPVVTLQESKDWAVLPENTIIQVELAEITEKKEPFEKFEWKFRVVGIPDALVSVHGDIIGQHVWGNTSQKFSLHPDNKLRQWATAMLGVDLSEGDVGFELNTDNLQGLRARAVMGTYTKKNGSVRNQVTGLLPWTSQEQQAPVPVAAVINVNDVPPF